MKLSQYAVNEVCSSTEWKAFYAFPKRIYDAHPHLAPLPDYEVRRLLDVQSNPFFTSYSLRAFIAVRDGMPIARLTLHLPVGGHKRPATFGFFEAADDQKACDLIFDHIRRICVDAGVESIEGPYNPSFRSVSGIQLNGFDNPTVFTEPCNPSYYPDLLTNAGFSPVVTGYTWMCNDMSRFEEGSRDIRDAGRYRVQHVRRTDLRHILPDVENVIRSSFSNTWNENEAHHDGDLYAAQWLFEGWLNDAIALVYKDEEPVGAIICVPDITPLIKKYEAYPRFLRRLLIQRGIPTVQRLVFYAIAMKKEYRNTAASYLLMHSFQNIASRFQQVHSSWITNGNHASERMARRFGLEPWKKFALFGTQLQLTSIQP